MAKIKVKAKSRVLIREDWRGVLDQIDYDQDEWDEWLEEPAAQESGGQGRVRMVRAGMQKTQYYPRGGR